MIDNYIAAGLFSSIVVTLLLCPTTSASTQSRVVWLMLSAVCFGMALVCSVPGFQGAGKHENWGALLYYLCGLPLNANSTIIAATILVQSIRRDQRWLAGVSTAMLLVYVAFSIVFVCHVG